VSATAVLLHLLLTVDFDIFLGHSHRRHGWSFCITVVVVLEMMVDEDIMMLCVVGIGIVL
jgi:hypothetical protein